MPGVASSEIEARARRRGGRLDRRHHADEGRREALAQGRQDQRRGGVAGDDHEVRPVRRDEPLHHREHAGDEGRLAEPAVREGGVVAGIDVAGVRPGAAHRVEDRQAAEAGIEHQDGRLGGAAQTPRRTSWPRPSDRSAWRTLDPALSASNLGGEG